MAAPPPLGVSDQHEAHVTHHHRIHCVDPFTVGTVHLSWRLETGLRRTADARCHKKSGGTDVLALDLCKGYHGLAERCNTFQLDLQQ